MVYCVDEQLNIRTAQLSSACPMICRSEAVTWMGATQSSFFSQSVLLSLRYDMGTVVALHTRNVLVYLAYCVDAGTFDCPILN
jgi:hypothetical protein